MKTIGLALFAVMLGITLLAAANYLINRITCPRDTITFVTSSGDQCGVGR
jgi:hypothetical protein